MNKVKTNLKIKNIMINQYKDEEGEGGDINNECKTIYMDGLV